MKTLSMNADIVFCEELKSFGGRIAQQSGGEQS